MRWFITVCLLLSLGVAHAQTTTPAAAPKRHTLADRFDAANTTQDGHLTAEQARSGMPSVARDFVHIDADHKGYVTLDEIKAYNKAKRAARKAAKAQ